MLEVTGDDVALLSDEALRVLVAYLCEAEVSTAKHSTSTVTAGGNQNAPDGGIDVRVTLPGVQMTAGYIPRSHTGFQVKVSDMPRSAIIEEMRPSGVLRQSIKALADHSGAYIIVSSHGSVSDSVLSERCVAMRDALADYASDDKLHLDFYDRNRLGAWVRCYPGLENWVRQQIGRPLQGWRTVENWSNPSEPPGSEYIIDEVARLYDDRDKNEGPLSIADGIGRLRVALGEPGAAIRLVGLSGLGKTRLLQALFDSRIGSEALDSKHSLYTDIGDEPIPSVREMANELVRRGGPGILLIDNCPPDTHHAVADICSKINSPISVITVEYDVRSDEPEGSQVFRLEPASDAVIETLIERRYPDISPPARRRLSEFAGGNARVALALAHTVRSNESLGDLTDAQLFGRLFHQRKAEDEGLLQSAQACALVYSFEGVELLSQEAELPILATLANTDTHTLHRHVAELRRRSLVQMRSRWRAILPHALANRLAKQALEDIPIDALETTFSAAPDRLLKSFSRRLGYLHDSPQAVALCERWLAREGMLGNAAALSVLGFDMFMNIAPVAPQKAFAAIERAMRGEQGAEFISPSNSQRGRWTALLRSLAYDPSLFDRAAVMLAEFVAAETETRNYNSAKTTFDGLFHLYLSGTHARAEQRLHIITTLMTAADERWQRLGLHALGEMMQASHFSSGANFEFGARPRDYGWQPTTWGEVHDWYAAVIEKAKALALSASPYAANARTLFAEHFRALATRANAFDELENAMMR